MRKQNAMKLEFLAIPQNVELARTVVCFFKNHIKMSEEEINEVNAAVTEAVDNIVEHAYPNCTGNVKIICRILKGNMLDIVIKDKGIGIENIERAMQTFYTTGTEEHSGLGFTIMNTFMTSVKVKSTFSKGTCVCMKKKIN